MRNGLFGTDGAGVASLGRNVALQTPKDPDTAAQSSTHRPVPSLHSSPAHLRQEESVLAEAGEDRLLHPEGRIADHRPQPRHELDEHLRLLRRRILRPSLYQALPRDRYSSSSRGSFSGT